MRRNVAQIPINQGLHRQAAYSKIAISGRAVWKYYCYDDGQRPNLWASWYANDADDRDRGAHDERFDILEQLSYWQLPYVKPLSKGLLEIKIRGTLEWRILGFYYPKGQRRVFTILLICYHKQKRYYPHQDAIARARERMKKVEAGLVEVHESDRP